MRFQVPQFIETETKLVGPFTLKQFMFIGAGGLLVFLFRYVMTNVFLWVIASLPIVGAAFALAFYKIDGIPLPNYIMAALSFMTGIKKYIYKKGFSPSDIDDLLK